MRVLISGARTKAVRVAVAVRDFGIISVHGFCKLAWLLWIYCAMFPCVWPLPQCGSGDRHRYYSPRRPLRRRVSMAVGQPYYACVQRFCARVVTKTAIWRENNHITGRRWRCCEGGHPRDPVFLEKKLGTYCPVTRPEWKALVVGNLWLERGANSVNRVRPVLGAHR